MQENYDYVTMDSYSTDMAELSGRAAAIIAGLKKRADEAERIACELIIAAGGKIAIPSHDLLDRQRRLTLTQWYDEANMKHIFVAEIGGNGQSINEGKK